MTINGPPQSRGEGDVCAGRHYIKECQTETVCVYNPVQSHPMVFLLSSVSCTDNVSTLFQLQL